MLNGICCLGPEHTAEASVPPLFGLLAHPSAVLETKLRFVLTFSALCKK